VVLNDERLAQGKLKDLLRARRERDVPAWRLLAQADLVGDVVPDAVQSETEAGEHLAGDRLRLAEQAEQEVLGPDVVVVQPPRLFLGEDHDMPRAVGESLEHETRVLCTFNPVNTMLIIGTGMTGTGSLRGEIMRLVREGGRHVDWEDRLDDWELELELGA